MDLINAALARLSGDRTDAMQRSQPQIPSYRYQDREGRKVRLTGSDGSEAEVRMLTSGSLQAGDPVIRVGSVGIGRDGSRMPERRRFRPLPVETGFWVYSSNEGAFTILQNDDLALHFTYNTRPNTALWEGWINFYTFDGSLDREDYYHIREVDFTFARYITVTDPIRLTITCVVDHLVPQYTSPGFFSAVPADLNFLIFKMTSTLPTLTSPDNIRADTIAQTTAGTFFASAYINEGTYSTGEGPNTLPSFALDNVWNRRNTFAQTYQPVFGIDFQTGGTIISANTEGTKTRTLNITEPGTYLLLGVLGIEVDAPIMSINDGVSTTFITDPDSNMIWWMDFDTTIAIAPIPPEPEP